MKTKYSSSAITDNSFAINYSLHHNIPGSISDGIKTAIIKCAELRTRYLLYLLCWLHDKGLLLLSHNVFSLLTFLRSR
jgi:hypothetical protein